MAIAQRHETTVILITGTPGMRGWRDAGYQYLATCTCGYRKECIAEETAENAAAEHFRVAQ